MYLHCNKKIVVDAQDTRVNNLYPHLTHNFPQIGSIYIKYKASFYI